MVKCVLKNYMAPHMSTQFMCQVKKKRIAVYPTKLDVLSIQIEHEENKMQKCVLNRWSEGFKNYILISPQKS